jgi:hypothetical protein
MLPSSVSSETINERYPNRPVKPVLWSVYAKPTEWRHGSSRLLIAWPRRDETGKPVMVVTKRARKNSSRCSDLQVLPANLELFRERWRRWLELVRVHTPECPASISNSGRHLEVASATAIRPLRRPPTEIESAASPIAHRPNRGAAPSSRPRESPHRWLNEKTTAPLSLQTERGPGRVLQRELNADPGTKLLLPQQDRVIGVHSRRRRDRQVIHYVPGPGLTGKHPPKPASRRNATLRMSMRAVERPVGIAPGNNAINRDQAARVRRPQSPACRPSASATVLRSNFPQDFDCSL